MFGGLGVWELLFIFMVVLLLFGAKRLPEIGASLGKGIREFKGSLHEIEKEMKISEPPPTSGHVSSSEETTGPRRLKSDAGPAAQTVGGERAAPEEVVAEESDVD